jgi:uncharacterized membrane protein
MPEILQDIREFVRIESPPALFAFLAAIIAVIFWLADRPKLRFFFRYLPALIWTYFVPMILASLGVIPHQSPLYDFVSEIILPATVVLLLIPSDIPAIARVGPKAIAMMLIGTAGIIIGAVVSFAFFVNVLPAGTLQADLWKGIASLSGSWIGGSPNMVAVAKSLETDPTLIGKIVVVDTTCAYTWLGLLIASVGFRSWFDRKNRADSSLVAELAARLSKQQAERERPLRVADFIAILAIAFVVSQVCLRGGGLTAGLITDAEAAGGWMHQIGLSRVMSAFGWGILLTTVASVCLSFTRMRNLEGAGASAIGNVGLYLLLTTIGATADLGMIQAGDVWLIAIGALWLLIHIVVLLIGARLLRAPLFLVATASMANVGGTASAPVVASAFDPSLAPVGLLLAVLGGIIGTPIGLLIVGKACAAITGG